MRGRLLQFIFTIIFICALVVPAYSAGETALAPNMKITDSVNVKQILLGQIQKAKEKMKAENKVYASENEQKVNKPVVAVTGSVKNTTTTAGIADDLFMRIFVLVDAGLGAFLFILWRRRKQNINKAEKTQLKENIIRLRQEKVGKKSDKILDSNRKRLKVDPALDLAADDQYMVKHAKKLSVSVGELQLAARIKSYQRETA